MCLAASKNFSTVCTLRFLIGLAESTFYPAIQVGPSFMATITTADVHHSI